LFFDLTELNSCFRFITNHDFDGFILQTTPRRTWGPPQQPQNILAQLQQQQQQPPHGYMGSAPTSLNMGPGPAGGWGGYQQQQPVYGQQQLGGYQSPLQQQQHQQPPSSPFR
jgi:hypothetical protein